MEIEWNKSLDELKSSNFKNTDKIYFICSKCKKQQMLRYKSCIARDEFICRACRGVETQLKLSKANPNYGWFAYKKDSVWMKSDEFLEKRKTTMKKRYGAEYTFQSADLRNRCHNTMVLKYGENYQKDVFQELREKTNMKKSGVRIRGFQDNESKEKTKETCLKKYGVHCTALVPEIRAKQKRKYKVDNVCFDSMQEIYYYYWLKDNNINFEYNKPYPKTYIGNDNKSHTYFYDFYYDGQYYELKGDCFFTNGRPISNYTNKVYDWTDKYNFMLNEKINIILTSRIEQGDLKFIKDNFLKNHQNMRIER